MDHSFSKPVPSFRPPRAAVLPLVAAVVVLASASRAQDVVRIETGLVQGERPDPGSNLRVFRGIPYAAPPLGALRWRPPQRAASWEGVRPAVDFAPACPQSPLIALLSGESLPPTSEDCLYLNVWSTAANAEAKLPVFVWMHGGGYVGGWANMKPFDGAPFAAQGLVFVSVNYRLGPLGFFAHPELATESEHGTSGNQGLLDQIAALEWVQRNVAAFGGDPGRVTIAGESAGGTSVCALCTSPLARGLFHGAVVQSAWLTDTNVLSRAEAEAQGKGFAELLIPEPEARTLAALRALPADKLWQVLGERFQPALAVDGWALESAPEDAFAAGRAHDVPVLAGTTADEGTVFVTLFRAATVAAYEERLAAEFGDASADVLELYPAARDADVPGQIARLVADRWFVRGTRTLLAGMEQLESRAWQYVFTRGSGDVPALGAHHAVELCYVFAALDARAPAADRELSAAAFAYWVNFAKTGDPNGPGLAPWPEWTAADERYLVLGTPITTGSAYRKEACALLDALRHQRKAPPTAR